MYRVLHAGQAFAFDCDAASQLPIDFYTPSFHGAAKVYAAPVFQLTVMA
jgi:hypothetical protein